MTIQSLLREPLIFLALFAIGIPITIHGAQIEWDSVDLWSDGHDESADAYIDIYYAESDLLHHHEAHFWITAEKDGDWIHVTGGGGSEMEYWINRNVSEHGDIVDESSVLDNSSPTDWSSGASEEVEDRKFFLPAGTSSIFYLSFAGANYNSPEIFYGWMELEFHEWEFNLLHSAVTVGGGPLVVGLLPVPEPGTLALAVLGIVVLGMSLARRKAEGARTFPLRLRPNCS